MFNNSRKSKVIPNGRQGFTLIELLVVIAIIGMLSSVVLVSLNSARGKGADVAIKANLRSIRLQAEIVYDSAGCYTSKITGGTPCASVVAVALTGAAVCPASGASNIFGESVIAQGIANAKSQSANNLVTCSSTAGGTAYAVAAQLKTDTTKAWCVDSAGIAKQVATAATQTGLNSLVSAGACL